jgi:acetyl/propionyl-CoA carboxylase alpha subunit
LGAVTPRPPFPRVLVANRGEIARRVVRTVKRLGAEAVAVYSDADRGAAHVKEADRAVRLGPPAPSASYLRVDAVVAAAKSTGCAALHPGYGFLSERADLARACEQAGIAFVGPPAAVLEATNDKLGVKARVAKAGVPVVPGPLEPLAEGEAALRAAAKATGFPMLLKAVGGGGGRGLRRVVRAEDLLGAAESARREAGGAFADARLYAEALVEPARHVEVQILCGPGGDVRVLGERDCSLQRRHQKVVEECPAPNLAPATRKTLHDAAAAAARALGYVNAGTVEFLVGPDGRAWFLEVNRRLQVEHPVTEAVFGLDLVEWQLRVAAGEALPKAPAWTPMGHSVEARVCAEDPDAGFLPSVGRVLDARWPSGEGVRVDAGFRAGDEVSPHYDSLLAKVIAHGATREEAVSRLDAALASTAVLGVRTNVAFLRRCLESTAFRAGAATVGLLDSEAGKALAAEGPVPPVAVLAAAAAEMLGVGEETAAAASRGRAAVAGPWTTLPGWRLLAGARS